MGTCVCVSWALFFQPAPPACPSQIKTRPWHVFGRQLSQIRLSKQAGHRLEDKVSVFQHKITKKKPHVFFGTKTFNSLKMSCWTPRPLSKDIGHFASIFFFFFFLLCSGKASFSALTHPRFWCSSLQTVQPPSSLFSVSFPMYKQWREKQAHYTPCTKE